MCIAKYDLAPSALYLEKEISSFTHSFHFLHRFELKYFFLEIVSSIVATTHIFQSAVRIWPVSMSRCTHLQDGSFQSTVVILMPKARELVGLVTFEHCCRGYFIQTSIVS